MSRKAGENNHLEKRGVILFKRILKGGQRKDEQGKQQNKDHTPDDQDAHYVVSLVGSR